MRSNLKVEFKAVMIGAAKALVHLGGSLIFNSIRNKANFEASLLKNPRHVLYISLAYRGDFILCFPALAALRRRFPDAKITCWVRKYNEHLVELNPDINQTIVFDDFKTKGISIFQSISFNGAQNDFLRFLKDKKFDLCIDDSGFAFCAIICARAGIPLRIGRNTQGFGFLYHFEYAYDFDAPLVLKRFRLLERLGVSDPGAGALIPRITIPEELKRKTLQKLGFEQIDKGYFTVQPYAGWPAKNWNDDKFAFVIEQFASLSKLTPVFIGGQSDEAGIAAMAAKISCKSISAAGTLELHETAALISGAKYHIGVDSVGSHLAAATGVRSLTLFGPTNPRLIAVLTEKNIAVFKNTACTPAPNRIYCCRDAGRSCRDVVCMRELREGDVFDILTKTWRGEKVESLAEF